MNEIPIVSRECGTALSRIVEMLKVYFSRLGFRFWILWMTMFTVMFAEYLTDPALPFLLEVFLIEEVAVVAMIGYLDSAYSLASTAMRIPSGILADKVERSVIILFALCLLPLSYLLLSFATGSWWVLAAVIIYGVFEGLSMPSFDSVIADLAPQSRRAMIFGIYSLSWILSSMLAPAVGGFLSDKFFLHISFILAFLISIVGILIYLGSLKGLKKPRLTYQTNTTRTNEIAASPPASFRQTLGLLCGMQFLNGLGNGILYPITVAFLMYALGTTPTELGIVFSIGLGFAAALAQIPGGKVADKFGPKPVIVVCTLISTPLLILQPLSTNVFQFALIFGLIGFIGHLSSPAYFAWIANLIGTEKRGKGYGFSSASFGAGAIIGPIIGSFIWTLLEPNHFVPFAVATIPFVLTIPFIVSIKKGKES